MRKLMLAAVALTLATGLAQAAEDERKISNPTAIVQSVTADDVAGLLREMGGADITITEGDGEKIVSFRDGGVPFNIAVAVCEKANAGKCYGLAQLMMLKDTGYSYASLNALNIETLTLTLFKNEQDGYVGLARVELIDGGVTRERLANAISWYVVEVHEAVAKLTKQVVAGVGADGKTKSLAMDGAAAPQPVVADPKIVAQVTKALTRLTDKRPLRKLNAQ